MNRKFVSGRAFCRGHARNLSSLSLNQNFGFPHCKRKHAEEKLGLTQWQPMSLCPFLNPKPRTLKHTSGVGAGCGLQEVDDPGVCRRAFNEVLLRLEPRFRHYALFNSYSDRFGQGLKRQRPTLVRLSSLQGLHRFFAKEGILISESYTIRAGCTKCSCAATRLFLDITMFRVCRYNFSCKPVRL